MVYNLNTAVFASSFPFPNDVVDKYIKLCKAEHLKVLIYIMRNLAKIPTIEEISYHTDISNYDVKEAILFWADTGILTTQSNAIDADRKAVIKKIAKPSREDVAKRGLEDEKLRYLFNQTQLIFGRNLKGNEVETLGWIYDDLGLNPSVILFIIQYAKQQNKTNITFIEKIAADWAEKNIETIYDAELELKNIAITEQAWKLVSSIFGIERRKPSKKESELSVKWINEWKITKEQIKEAYDICIDTNSKYSFAYISKIIENWHNGFDVTAKPKKKTSKNNASYDIDLFEAMLNSED